MTEPRTYRIVAAGQTVDLFRTAETAEASADLNACENLHVYSVHHPGLLTLEYVDEDCTAPIAEARGGDVVPLVDPDALAADGCHCGPAIVPLDESEVGAIRARHAVGDFPSA